MAAAIRISTPEAGEGAPRRLNLFPGRYLRQQEFGLLQGYVDQRIAPLLATLQPGIVRGLDVTCEVREGEAFFSIEPGMAIAADGSLVRLVSPLRQEWQILLEEVRRRGDGDLADGLYWLTVRAEVRVVDQDPDPDPATRTEENPVRELLLQTVTVPDLWPVSFDPELLQMPQPARCANSIMNPSLTPPSYPGAGSVAVALVKVVTQQPQWIDTAAGRYLSAPNSPYRAFLSHTLALLDRWAADGGAGDASVPLAELLGVDFLPAAGMLPPRLLRDPAEKAPQLLFDKGRLQVELMAVPASTVQAVIESELSRGPVDITQTSQERIRLLLAIPDEAYSPDLMDLPQRDTRLEDDLFRLEHSALQAFYDWQWQWLLLYDGLSPEEAARFGVPAPKTRPGSVDDFRIGLVARRRDELEAHAESKGNMPELPEPYLSHLLAPHLLPVSTVQAPEPPAEKLLVEREALRGQVRSCEAALAESYRLLNELADFLTLQRQHLDSVTVSMSALAGGVAGDGLGAKMSRWSSSAVFLPDNAVETTE